MSSSAYTSFCNRVSHPDDVLERMIGRTLPFMENRCSMIIIEDDVRSALTTMGFQVPHNDNIEEKISQRDPFHQRVSDILNKKFLTDLRVKNSALAVLKVVEDAYRGDTTNFEVVQTPEKKGGRLLKLESPTGVTAKYFEFDWIKDDRNDDDEEMEGDEWIAEEDEEDVELIADETSDEESDEDDSLIADEESDEFD